MAKDKSSKKEKKSAASPIDDPVVDSATRVSKKEKKDKKSKAEKAVAAEAADVTDDEGGAKVVVSSGDLVPFAQPLAEEKVAKKLFKATKKAAKNKCLKRGVKEVVKALRKAPKDAAALVVLAADISPMDVISHIPVLCEDHDIRYVFVKSRAELGAAGATKRPTSVVMLTPGTADGKKKKKKAKDGEMEVDEKDAGDDGFREAYDEAVKLVETTWAR